MEIITVTEETQSERDALIAEIEALFSDAKRLSPEEVERHWASFPEPPPARFHIWPNPVFDPEWRHELLDLDEDEDEDEFEDDAPPRGGS